MSPDCCSVLVREAAVVNLSEELMPWTLAPAGHQGWLHKSSLSGSSYVPPGSVKASIRYFNLSLEVRRDRFVLHSLHWCSNYFPCRVLRLPHYTGLFGRVSMIILASKTIVKETSFWEERNNHDPWGRLWTICILEEYPRRCVWSVRIYANYLTTSLLILIIFLYLLTYSSSSSLLHSPHYFLKVFLLI